MQKRRPFYFLMTNLVGTILYAAGITCFTAPHHIAPGGASGIAILVNYATQFPIGVFVFLFNIPPLIVALRYFSKEFIIKTLFSTLMLSLVTDLLVTRFPIYQGDPLLASMFGGALMGVGLAVVHLGGSNTGGISLVVLILQKIWPHLQVGRTLSLLNITVVAASGLVYGNIESVLYAMVCTFISGNFMDQVISSISANSFLIIISREGDRIKRSVLSQHRGVTELEGRGGYSGDATQVLLCASNRPGAEQLERLVKQTDPNAFVVVTDASCVIGKNFHGI